MSAYDHARPLHRRRHAGMAILTVVAAIAAGIFLDAPPSDAADPGTVTGTVRLAGSPAPAGSVRVVLRDFWDGQPKGEVSTDAAGAYRFEGVTPGRYDIFFDFLPGDAYADRWYTGGGGSLSSAALVVDADGAVADIDLARGATIAGVVRTSKGTPIAGVTVLATFLNSAAQDPVVRSAVSDAAGVYRIGGLPAGSFGLQFSHPAYPDQFRGQDVVAGVPDAVAVASGATVTGVNMTMYRASRVTVSLTCSTCSRGVSSAEVRIERQIVSSNGVVSWRDAAETTVTAEQATTRDYTATTSLVPGRYRAYSAVGRRYSISTPLTLAEGGSAHFVVPLTSEPPRGDYDAAGGADVFARASDGWTYLYRSSGTGGWFARNERSGWGAYTSLTTIRDFDSNGGNDLLARSSSGMLYLISRRYDGLPTRDDLWLAPQVVGSGWNQFTLIFSPGDFTGDGHSDVLAETKDGRLFLYPGTGLGDFQAGRQVGSGWSAFTAVSAVGDFDADGFADVIARAANGILWLYPGNGAGGWKPRKQIGSGWSSFTAIIGPGDFNGDGTDDVMARAANGNLYLYPTNGRGGWLPSRLIGSGWQALRMVG